MRKKSAPIPTASSRPPILLVDPGNIFGVPLYESLKDESFVVLVGTTPPKSDEQLLYLPYKNRVPKIPNSFYHYIYFVWDGKKDMLSLLPEFIRKARADRVPFVFILPYRFLSQASLQKIIPQYKNLYVFILGDLFGTESKETQANLIDNFVHDAKTKGGVRVSGMGLPKVYPVTYADSILAIRHALAEKRAPGVTYYVFPQTPVTQLSVLRILQKVDPLIHIDFLPEKKKKHIESFTPGSGEYLEPETYPLKEKIREYYQTMIVHKQQHVVVGSDNKTWAVTSTFVPEKLSKTKNPYLTALGLYCFYAVIIFIFTPFLATIGFAYFGVRNLTWGKEALEKGDLNAANIAVGLAKQSFTNASFMSSFFMPEAALLGQSSRAYTLADTIESGKTLAETAGFILESSLAYKQVFSGTSQFPTRDFLTGTNALKNAITDYELLGSSNAIPPEYKDKLQKLAKPVQYISMVGSVLPQIFGVDSVRTYAILFQNNMELRPGGGFIGSYGILKLQKGKILEFSIHDVYDADGQLKGHIEPPFALRRYLPIVHLYLRDSNFDVDFAQGASLVANLLQAETGQKVNGIMGVDMSFVKNLIASTGSIYVPEYNETVTANNFFTLTEKHAEKNFFPGSSQKKDFLRSLFTALQAKLITHKNISFTGLLDATAQAIGEKHILFAFDDPGIQSIFTANDMSSSIINFDNNTDSDIADFVGVNEANLGVNKVNYFINRSISIHDTIDQEGIYSGDVTITYRNTSKKDTWPGGDYKNYIRIILAKGSVLTGVSIDDHDEKLVPAVTDPLTYEKKGFIPPSGFEIEHYDENGRSIYGFLVNIPAGEGRKVKASYILAQKFDLSKPLQRYSMHILKQPGTDTDPFAFSIDYPDSFHVINATAGFSNAVQTMSYIDYLRGDQTLAIDFAKK